MQIIMTIGVTITAEAPGSESEVVLCERGNVLCIDVGNGDLNRVLEQMQWALETVGKTGDTSVRAAWYDASNELRHGAIPEIMPAPIESLEGDPADPGLEPLSSAGPGPEQG